MKGVMIFLVLTLVVLMAGESLGGDNYGTFDSSNGHNTHVGGNVGDIGESFNGVRYRSRWQRSPRSPRSPPLIKNDYFPWPEYRLSPPYHY